LDGFPAPRSTGQHRYDAPGIGLAEGLTFTLTVAPGVAALSVVDQTRQERAVQRVSDALRHQADVAATYLAEAGEVPDRVPSRIITEWSARSRSRMVRKFASVDWTALHVEGEPLGMVTLTYPGDWLAVCPTGRVAKRHLAAFRQRFRRAVGRRLDGAWKLEFQGRGAPHFHLLMPIPALVRGERFEAWLSRTWADIVGAEGEERRRHELAGTGVDFASTARMSDPKRLAVYFLKHGTKSHDGKEYQHEVPQEWLVDDQGEVTPESGPGRFWGFWGMKPAEVALELDVRDFITVKRTLRRVAQARARSVAWSRARHQMPAWEAISVTSGRTRVLGSSRLVGGFVVVNDGTALARDLARAVNLRRLL